MRMVNLPQAVYGFHYDILSSSPVATFFSLIQPQYRVPHSQGHRSLLLTEIIYYCLQIVLYSHTYSFSIMCK